MRLLVEPCNQLPLVNVAVSFRGGRIHEPAGVSGLARLTARMLRRGSEGMSAEAVEQGIDRLGGEFGAHVGLGTSNVSFEVLTRNLAAMVDLVANLIAKPTVDDDELAKLKRQSEAETVRSRDSDSFLAGRALRRHLLRDHPHGRRIGGTIEEVRAIDAEAIRSFHAKHYSSSNAIVSICGDVEADAAEGIAERLLAQLPAGESIEYPATDPPPPRGRHLVVVDKPNRTQAQMVIGTLGTHPKDDDHTALLVANTAFGGSFTARLVQEIRAKRGWSYGASSLLSTSLVRETFSMWTAPATRDAAACLALQLEMLRAWVAEGIDQDELDFCKGYLRRSYAFEIDTAKKRLQQALERELFHLPDDFHERFVDHVDAVSLDDANAAIARRISADDLWISVTATEAAIGTELRDAAGPLVESIVDPYDLE